MKNLMVLVGRSDVPHAWDTPTYGAKQQFAPPTDTSPRLPFQAVVGTFLYYAVAVDLSMLVTLGTIAFSQAKPTELI